MRNLIWAIIILLMIIFIAFVIFVSPSVTPPKHMGSSDPYWYSGE